MELDGPMGQGGSSEEVLVLLGLWQGRYKSSTYTKKMHNLGEGGNWLHQVHLANAVKTVCVLRACA